MSNLLQEERSRIRPSGELTPLKFSSNTLRTALTRKTRRLRRTLYSHCQTGKPTEAEPLTSGIIRQK